MFACARDSNLKVRAFAIQIQLGIIVLYRLSKSGDRHRAFSRNPFSLVFDSLYFMQRLTGQVTLAAMEATHYRYTFDHKK